MKKILYILFLFPYYLFAQDNSTPYYNFNHSLGVGVTKGTAHPTSVSLIVGDSAATKAMIIPRVQTVAAILNPRQGMVVYSISDSSFYYRTLYSWYKPGGGSDTSVLATKQRAKLMIDSSFIARSIYSASGFTGIGGTPSYPLHVKDTRTNAYSLAIEIGSGTTGLVMFPTSGNENTDAIKIGLLSSYWNVEGVNRDILFHSNVGISIQGSGSYGKFYVGKTTDDGSGRKFQLDGGMNSTAASGYSYNFNALLGNNDWPTKKLMDSTDALKLNIADTSTLSNRINLKANTASPAFTGTATGIGLPVYARVTGSNATTTGQALVDITGLTVALVSSATYEFEAVLEATTTAVTTGTAYGINFSAAGATVESHVTGAFTSTASKTERINALNTATSAFLTTSAQSGGILIKGIITTTTNSGNITVSHLKLTSGTSTVLISSFIKVTRIL